MPAPDMKLLRQQLNKTCTTALEAAAAACIGRTHYEITVEHLLTALLDANGTDRTRIMCADGEKPTLEASRLA